MKDNRKRFSVKDIIIIIICMIVLIVLLLLLKKTRENQQMEQEQLSQLQEQIQQGEIVGTETKSEYKSVVLNEVNQEGWIELYNNSKTDVSLEDITVYIEGEPIKTFKEAQTIAAGELLVLDLGQSLGDEEHSVLSIQNAEENRICSFIIPELDKRESYGCIGNGNAQMGYQTASKGEDNSKDAVITKDDLTFSIPGGFYSDAISLEITAPAGTEVYYTLDGNMPTSESTKYEGSIKLSNRTGSNYSYAAIVNNGYKPSSIEMGNVVRAVAIDQQGNIVAQKTESYFIGLANNSDIVNLPVISLTTDSKNLFDYFEGMYVQGKYHEDALASGMGNEFQANYLQGWVKDAHIEYFEGNKDKSYEADIQLSMLHDYSLESPQKSFKVTGDENGAWKGSSLYTFYNDDSRVLEIQTNRRDNDSKSREYLANALLEDTTVGTADLTPCVLFINGEYWGGYMLRSPVDQLYFEKHYGVSKDETVILAKEGVVDNYEYRDSYKELINYIESNDMSNAENYSQVEQMMDVQSYLDYLCANIYLANVDYGVEEAYAWRTADVGQGEYRDGRWRWIIGKLNCSMNASTANGMSTSSIDTFLMPTVREDVILRSLICNNKFKEQLQKTMKRMAEEIFAPDIVENELNMLTTKIGKMAVNSYERFFGYPNTTFYADNTKRIQKFFDERGQYILYYTDNLEEVENAWEEIEKESVNTVEDTNEIQNTEQVNNAIGIKNNSENDNVTIVENKIEVQTADGKDTIPVQEDNSGIDVDSESQAGESNEE